MTIEALRKLCTDQTIYMTKHAAIRIRERGISLNSIKAVIGSGEIIAQYPDDHPYPSCLVLGFLPLHRPLHVVVGLSDKALWIITSYFPDKAQWETDYKTRKEDA